MYRSTVLALALSTGYACSKGSESKSDEVADIALQSSHNHSKGQSEFDVNSAIIVGHLNGNEVGNGGDGVVCYNNNRDVVSLETLDVFEARAMRGLHYDFGPADGSTAIDKAKYMIRRLEMFDPARYRQYAEFIDNFLADANFLEHTSLPDVPDSGYVPVPASCGVVQIAVQSEPLVPHDKRYRIDGDLWNDARFDDNQKAAMILHEIVYRDAIARGHWNSIQVRYFASLIGSNAMTAFSADQYANLIHNLNLDGYMYLSRHESFSDLYRYYDNLQLGAEAGQRYCRALTPGGELARFLWIGEGMIHSPIGRAIANRSREGSVSIWNLNKDDIWEVVDFANAQDESSWQIASDLNERNHFICTATIRNN